MAEGKESGKIHVEKADAEDSGMSGVTRVIEKWKRRRRGNRFGRKWAKGDRDDEKEMKNRREDAVEYDDAGIESRPYNESFARVSAAAFLAQLNRRWRKCGCQDGDFGGGYECDDSDLPAGKRKNSDEVCAGSGGEGVQVTVKDTGVGIEKWRRLVDESMFTTRLSWSGRG